MPGRFYLRALVAFLSLSLVATALAQDSIRIRAGTLIDGKGGVERNVVVTFESGRISKVAQVGMTGAQRVTYDFPKLTLLPGMIDTHVHLNYHFGPDGRYIAGEEPAPRLALYSAENAYAPLMAGFTMVRSIGAPSDAA